MEYFFNRIVMYLPYDIDLYHAVADNSALIGTMTTGELLGYTEGRYSKFLPILKPKSDLFDKESEECKIKSLFDIRTWCDQYDEWLSYFVDSPDYEKLLQAPLEIVLCLIKNHFDVFGLIDEGLAIDSNVWEKTRNHE